MLDSDLESIIIQIRNNAGMYWLTIEGNDWWMVEACWLVNHEEEFPMLRLVMMRGARPWWFASFPEFIDYWGRWLMDGWSKLIDEPWGRFPCGKAGDDARSETLVTCVISGIHWLLRNMIFGLLKQIYRLLKQIGGLLKQIDGLLKQIDGLLKQFDWGIKEDFSVLRLVMMRGSETLVALIGMTSIISSISHSLGLVFQV